MNQSKFSLADLLTLLTALVFGFVCFLGANFFTLGEIAPSIILAAIIVVLLCATALGAKLLKRTRRNFKTCFVLEITLLVLFTGLIAFFSYSPFSHFFVVSEKRAEIQSKLTASITQAENMFAEYERYAANREDLYNGKLHSVVAAKNIDSSEYYTFGFIDDSVSEDKQIENKVTTLRDDLFPTNYKDRKQIASNWLEKARSIVENWKPIGIVGVVNEVEKNSNEWLSTLVELSLIRENGETADDFTYDLSFDDVKKHFTTLGKPTLVSIVFTAFVFLLMLLSWIVTKRHPKSPGVKELFKMIFGMSGSIDNEL